jgi:hypothetical protein
MEVRYISRQRYEIYTKDEADAKGIKYTYWKDAKEGDWCLSDDGYVGQVRMVKKYDRGTKYRTSMGVAWVAHSKARGGKLLYKKQKTWDEEWSRTFRVKNAVKLYSLMLMYGKGIDWDKLGYIIQPNSRIPRATARRMFRGEKIQKMISKELRALMEAEGMTESKAYELLNAAADIAIQRGDPGSLIKIAENLQEVYGHKGNKTRITETLQLDTNITRLIEGEEEEERKRITASRSVTESDVPKE